MLRSCALMLLSMCCLVAAAAGEESAGASTRAALIREGIPEYPMILRRFGNRGQVTVRIDVDAEGKILDPVVLTSSHPAFEREAIRWLLKQRAKPALRDGRPTASRVIVPVAFKLESGGRGDLGTDEGELPFDTQQVADAAGAAPDAKVIPASIAYVAPVVYPLDLLRSGTSGSASVRASIGRKGIVEGVEIEKADAPEFGLALKASVEAWRFHPETRNGTATPSQMRVRQHFDRRERDVQPSAAADALLRKLSDEELGVFQIQDLDSKPRARYRPKPVYPPGLRARGASGHVTVEFVIDRDGSVLLPAVVSADDPELGWSSVTAVSRWQFEPAMRGGKAVAARVRLPLQFDIAPQEPAPDPK